MRLDALLKPVEHRPRHRMTAVVTGLLSLALVIAGVVGYASQAPPGNLLSVQLLDDPARPEVLTWSFALIAGCGLGLGLGSTAALWVAWTPWTQRFYRFARIATLIAILGACLNVGLLLAFPEPDVWLAGVAVTSAVIAYPALVPAALGGVWGAVLTLIAALVTEKPLRSDDCLAPTPVDSEDPAAAWPAATGPSQRWYRGYQVPDVEPGQTGICLSG